ncbi:hypothetical protein [Aromatoleum anaerobium]|uniref:Uncharacterized protein n=1 Tax=Aromatoleum anaerobium TaxID=182180 RepID=A0ABX1PFI0_9RHOO|nr:hypothetical protein [Aromatoleum anaerobium]MCK0509197.1 hypothetical protein [Aromatoleum anaerobium]
MRTVIDAVRPACHVVACAALAFGMSVRAQAADLNTALLDISPNRWVRLHTPAVKEWSRQAHAGMAYDSKRGTLLIFGSNTHGLDWDNTVHEFDPVTARWVTHYPEAPQASYRADDKERAIAGGQRRLPWAMHTFAGVAYDPQRDGLIVAARPEHNPIGKKTPAAKIHPSWFYSQTRREWQMLPDSDQAAPKFFGAAAAYDERRRVAVAYRWGIWELLPQRGTTNGPETAWVKVSRENHHQMHHSMVYDSRRGNFAVFGDYRSTNDVWIYKPGARRGEEGRWEKRTPGGDACPRAQHFPVAFDRDQGVFLLVPGNTEFESLPNGRERARRPKSNSTFVYDPDANRYLRLPGADMPALGMNFMMAYDPRHKVFLLVSGGPSEAPTVWALKLDLAGLKR